MLSFCVVGCAMTELELAASAAKITKTPSGIDAFGMSRTDVVEVMQKCLEMKSSIRAYLCVVCFYSVHCSSSTSS